MGGAGVGLTGSDIREDVEGKRRKRGCSFKGKR
jgi:hypothetical protein